MDLLPECPLSVNFHNLDILCRYRIFLHTVNPHIDRHRTVRIIKNSRKPPAKRHLLRIHILLIHGQFYPGFCLRDHKDAPSRRPEIMLRLRQIGKYLIRSCIYRFLVKHTPVLLIHIHI